MQLNEVKIGAKDQRGRDIIDVFWSIEDFVIYQHPGGVSPHFSDSHENAVEQRRRYALIGPLLSEVNALRSGTAWRGASIDREIARGIAECLEGHLESAQKTLVAVRARLHNLRTIQGRLEYQGGSLIALLGMGLVCLLAWFTRSQEAANGFSILQLASIGAFGALGGFLSVAAGIKKVMIDPDADLKINVASGASRIVIAVIGSVLVYLAVISKLVLGNFGLTGSSAGIFAIAMVAGFSETYVPNILGRLARTVTDGHPEHSQAAERLGTGSSTKRKIQANT